MATFRVLLLIALMGISNPALGKSPETRALIHLLESLRADTPAYCEARIPQPLINGMETNEFPSVVYFSFQKGYCTGTIISQDILLTAAHCVTDLEDPPTTVGEG